MSVRTRDALLGAVAFAVGFVAPSAISDGGASFTLLHASDSLCDLPNPDGPFRAGDDSESSRDDGPALSRSQIKRHADQIQRSVDACVDALGPSDSVPDVDTFYLKFEIQRDGSVTDVTFKDEAVRESALADCVRSCRAAWQFPSHDGEPVSVAYPFVAGSEPDDGTSDDRKMRRPQADSSDRHQKSGWTTREIKVGIKGVRKSVSTCRDEVLDEDHPDLGERIQLTITVGEDGTVTEVRFADDSLKDTPFANCLRERTSNWEWPEPDNGTQKIKAPFIVEDG